MFTYCAAEAGPSTQYIGKAMFSSKNLSSRGCRGQKFFRLLPTRFSHFFPMFLQNKRSGEEVSCLHIVLPRLLRPLRPVGYHQFLMMLLPHDQFDCVLIAAVGSY